MPAIALLIRLKQLQLYFGVLHVVDPPTPLKRGWGSVLFEMKVCFIVASC